jgi:hypothetical protein
MVNVLIWMFSISVGFFTFMIIGENIAENLPPENRFRKWWRNTIIGDDIHDDDF